MISFEPTIYSRSLLLQVLFFEQVRTALSGGLLLSDQAGHIQHHSQQQQQQQPDYVDSNSNNNNNTNTDENWETVHQDFTALKGDLASIKVRIAEAERERQDATSKHMKAKGVLSSFKPEKLFNKLFANRGFSSSESSRDSISPEVVPTPSSETMTMKQQLRHSIA